MTATGGRPYRRARRSNAARLTTRKRLRPGQWQAWPFRHQTIGSRMELHGSQPARPLPSSLTLLCATSPVLAPPPQPSCWATAFVADLTAWATSPVLAPRPAGAGCASGRCWLLDWQVVASGSGGCWLLDWQVVASGSGGCWLLDWQVVASGSGGCWLVDWQVVASGSGGCWLVDWLLDWEVVAAGLAGAGCGSRRCRLSAIHRRQHCPPTNRQSPAGWCGPGGHGRGRPGPPRGAGRRLVARICLRCGLAFGGWCTCWLRFGVDGLVCLWVRLGGLVGRWAADWRLPGWTGVRVSTWPASWSGDGRAAATRRPVD